MKKALVWLPIAVLLASTAAASAVENPSGQTWHMTILYTDGRVLEAESLILEGFSGPVTFTHYVDGAKSVRLEAPSGIVETESYRAADRAMGLVVLDAKPEGTPWPAPQSATVESADTLITFTPEIPEGYRVTTGGYVEVPPGFTLINFALGPRGPAPVFDYEGRLIGLAGNIGTPDGILGYAIPAEHLIALREQDAKATSSRPLTDLTGSVPAWRDPLTPSGSTLCGGLLAREGRAGEGLVYLESVQDDNLPETFFEIGVANDYLGLRGKGADAFAKAASLRKCYTRALIHYGAEFFMVRRWAEAESLYLLAKECDPDNAQIYVNLGGLYHQQNRPTDAEKNFRKALEVDPEFDAARFNLGVTLKQKGRIEEARELIEEMRANGNRMARMLERILEES